MKTLLESIFGTELNGQISKKDGFILTSPKNSWDMNYHLIDFDNRIDYLIDIDDVFDTYEEMEENEVCGVLYSELVSLDNIDELIEISWKTTDFTW